MLGHDEVTNIIAYQGAIHTEGYAIYDITVSKFSLSRDGCLCHVQRKFTDLDTTCPQVLLPILHFIEQIFQNESQARLTKVPPVCRELICRTRSLPIAEEFH